MDLDSCVQTLSGKLLEYTFIYIKPQVHKKHAKTLYVELVFLLLVRSAGHVVLSGAYGQHNAIVLFFMLGWDWCGFQKESAGTCCAELVFFHPVGSASHVEHSSASRA
jgi:hypothetical protein